MRSKCLRSRSALAGSVLGGTLGTRPFSSCLAVLNFARKSRRVKGKILSGQLRGLGLVVSALELGLAFAGDSELPGSVLVGEKQRL